MGDRGSRSVSNWKPMPSIRVFIKKPLVRFAIWFGRKLSLSVTVPPPAPAQAWAITSLCRCGGVRREHGMIIDIGDRIDVRRSPSTSR